ncbi:hypothetical protein FOVSG1_003600 [Fusarium oxysporum f. sp. vasinfectum]
MLCFKGSKGYKVVPKKQKVKAATSTSTSTNQTSAPRTRNGTGTGTGTGTAAVTQPTNRVAAKSTRPSPDRSRNPPYSNSRPSPSRRHNPEQGPPIQPPRQQSKVARTNNMASQNGIFYGRADSAITSGFGDDESATAVQNPTSKSQGSSSSNTAQSQAHDRIPSHERPVINTAAAAAAASSSSSSSASPYERQALRAAVEEDENFFWCTSDCGSGQIHDSGSAQPIVVCIKCSHRSCFRHGVNWHEDLSCEEYDRLQEDPDFRGHLELENERWSKAQAAQAAQEEADRDLARRFVAKEKAKIKRQEAQDQRERERERERQKSQRERERERQKYQERRRELEREKQEKQRLRVRERQKNQERQRELERERQERQRALREKASAQKAAEERRQIVTRRKIEEAKSIATLRATTKPCGGCGWAIEKNSGCSHMTCKFLATFAIFYLSAHASLAIMLLHYHGYRRKCNYQFLPMGLHQVAEKCNRIHGHYSSYLVYTVQNVGMNSAGIAAPTIGLS